MGKKLIIVESPTKTRTLKKFLGDDYEIKASVGHIRDLPTKELGVDLEKNFKPNYVTIKGKGKIINELKKAAKDAELILLASDPDREGEAIAWHIAKAIGGDSSKIKRILFNEITKKAVLEAINNPSEIDMQKVNAQQARRILDRLVGYQVSPVLWTVIARGLSAGRVQSVALRLICEREAAIDKFIPEEYWSLIATLQGKKGKPFDAKLHRIGKQIIDNKKFKLGNKEEMDAILLALKDAIYQIKKIARKKKKRKAPPPFITSTLQQDASRRLGFSAKKTMLIAQKLYEGIVLGAEDSVGLITYMRTDSVRLSTEAVEKAREYIEKEFGKEYLPKSPIVYTKKKGSQDAHEAIRPTYTDHSPKTIQQYLSADQYKLYKLIWQRFLASQMKPAVYDTTTIDILAKEKYWFRAVGSIMHFEGYLKVYPFVKSKTGNGDEEKTNILPPLSEEEILKLLKLTPNQHFTQPPARFSEASLVKELESLGIGRPSTYASIVSIIITRTYVELIKKRFQPTELGKTVNKVLVELFPNIFNVEFTAELELELDKVETGEDDWIEILNNFYKPFSERLQKIMQTKKKLKQSLIETTEEICEECGAKMIIRWGRRGRFLACPNYPKCKFTKPLPGEENKMEKKEDIKTDEVCEKCGSPMIIKTGKYGRFLACSNYPKCRNIRSIKIGVKCPKSDCGGNVVEKRSKRGKLFYGCDNYPKCDFVSWNKPVNIACTECDALYMVQKHTKKKGNFLFCENCKAEKPYEEKEK